MGLSSHKVTAATYLQASALRKHGADSEKNASRLFVQVLSTQGHKDLCTALETLDKNVFHATPGDVFVFSLDNHAKMHYEKECPNAVNTGSASFEVLEEGWITPAQASNASEWHIGWASEGYRRMGHWRLVYPLSLAKSLGYKWVLQLDTDSVVLKQLQQNLIAELDSKGAELGARAVTIDTAVWGLPELTRYFLVSEQIQPTTLFQHCIPPNLDGVHSISAQAFSGGKSEEPAYTRLEVGWDRHVLFGNFVIISTDLWFRRDVQKYLALVLGTGGHFRFRWNEQAVVAMIWQIFVEPSKFHLFSFAYYHKDKIFAEGENEVFIS